MDALPLSALSVALVLLLIFSGFFAMAETAMMASNRYRLRALAEEGHGGARRALALLGQTDKLLGTVLLFNTLVNAAIATLAGLMTVQLFGEDKWALGAGTLAVSFLILVFAEIAPKVVGAAYPDKLAVAVPYLLGPIQAASNPVVSLVNLLVRGFLWLLRLKPTGHGDHSLSPEELRILVLESSHGVPEQHREILLNLFELEQVTVEDIMTPRSAMEAVDIAAPMAEIREKLGTAFHTRIPVFDGDPSNIIGILHQRRLSRLSMSDELEHANLREILLDPYFVPAGTGIYSQLTHFRENRQRLALVVDEYGDILGLISLEDIVEEIVGKFATRLPDNAIAWDEAGTVEVDGGRSIREVNQGLGLTLPVEGPRTLNGLVLEHLRDIPESGVSLMLDGVHMEVLQTEDRRIKRIRLFRPD